MGCPSDTPINVQTQSHFGTVLCRLGRASSKEGRGNLSCSQSLRSLQGQSADAPGDRSSCPEPSPALPWLFPGPGYGAAYVTGWKAEAGLGAPEARDGGYSQLPLSGQLLSTSILPVEVRSWWLMGLGAITVDSLASTSTLSHPSLPFWPRK